MAGQRVDYRRAKGSKAEVWMVVAVLVVIDVVYSDRISLWDPPRRSFLGLTAKLSGPHLRSLDSYGTNAPPQLQWELQPDFYAMAWPLPTPSDGASQHVAVVEPVRGTHAEMCRCGVAFLLMLRLSR